jgi:hypothetical protein
VDARNIRRRERRQQLQEPVHTPAPHVFIHYEAELATVTPIEFEPLAGLSEALNIPLLTETVEPDPSPESDHSEIEEGGHMLVDNESDG